MILRYRLKHAFGVFIVIGLALALPRYRSARLEYAAITLSRHGAEIRLSNRRPPQSYISRLIYGDDKYECVYSIRVPCRRFSQFDFRQLTLFRSCSQLFLDDCDNRQSVLLSSLKDLAGLERLQIEGNLDAGQVLSRIGRLAALKTLCIRSTASHIDLEMLSQFPRLSELWLDGAGFDDDALLALSHCTSVETLGLCNVSATNKSMGAISELPKLERLTLTNTKISDLCVSDGTWCSLRYLGIFGNAIDDRSITGLCTLNTLAAIQIESTNVSEEGVASLKRALPQCEVTQMHAGSSSSSIKLN